MWQPITDQHEYDEKASVALEVDPGQLRELVNYKHVQPEPLSFLFDILSISNYAKLLTFCKYLHLSETL